MAISRKTCLEEKELCESTVLQVVPVRLGSVCLWGDMLTERQRLLLPADLRQRIFATVHSLAHAGIRATRRLVAARFCWQGLVKDVGTGSESVFSVSMQSSLSSQPGQFSPFLYLLGGSPTST